MESGDTSMSTSTEQTHNDFRGVLVFETDRISSDVGTRDFVLDNKSIQDLFLNHLFTDLPE